jgi:hypothetical protein
MTHMTRREWLVLAGALIVGAGSRSVAELRAQKLLLDPVTAIHVCVAADSTLHLVDISADCPSGQQSLYLKKADADVDIKGDGPAKPPDGSCSDSILPVDREKLEDLERRVSALEASANRGELGNKVRAPFEVDSASGRKIFCVDERKVAFFNQEGVEVATIVPGITGGTFVARGVGRDLRVSVGAGERDGAPDAGLVVREAGVDRFSLARRGDGYVGLFYNGSGTRVAGIGQSQSGRGAVYVADSSGNVRAVMRMDEDNKPLFAVINSMNIATLGQGESLGGKLTLFAAGGGDPMVEAGSTAEGIGVVMTGPGKFKPGFGVLGLPSSYIAGKQ